MAVISLDGGEEPPRRGLTGQRVQCVSGDWEGVWHGRTEGVYVGKERKRYGGKGVRTNLQSLECIHTRAAHPY